MSLFYGNGVALTEKTLDLLWGRQNLTVNNIANVDTPNYKSKYLTFENELLHRISTAEQGGRKKSPSGMQYSPRGQEFTAQKTNPVD